LLTLKQKLGPYVVQLFNHDHRNNKIMMIMPIITICNIILAD